MLNFGDTIRFDIQLFNQGNVPMDSLVITDYIPTGFEYLPGFNPGWSGAGPTPTYQWGASEVLDRKLLFLDLFTDNTQVDEPTIDKYTNYAEISFASNTANIDQSSNDADSPLSNIDNDNPGGQPFGGR